MHELFVSSVFFGVVLSLAGYFIGVKAKEKTGLALMNPILIGTIVVVAVLSMLGIEYSVYQKSASLLSSLLTPATICLAVPLYKQVALLRRHRGAILAGIASGVITSLLCVLALSLLFGLDHAAYVTLLPKSVTSAIGMGIAQELGGYGAVTVAVIILTGVIGNITAETVCRLFCITHPVARGIAIGSSAHSIGTAKALEMGEIEGAMSSLSIVISGLLTVLGASLFSMIGP